MLVTPDDEVNEVGKEILRKVASISVCMAEKYVSLGGLRKQQNGSSLVLVHAHEVEPIVLLRCGLKEFDLAVTECPE